MHQQVYLSHKDNNNIINWSKKKYEEMKRQLTGYWQQDVWHPRENPFQERQQRKLGACIYFDKCPSIIKTELKYASYSKLLKKEWSAYSFHCGGTGFNLIIKWLITITGNNESLISKTLDQWLMSLRNYLLKQGKPLNKTEIKGFKKNGEPQKCTKQHDSIHKFRQIYNVIKDVYDTRDEYEKGIWDMRRLGITDKYINSSHNHLLDFTQLENSWLYKASQNFIKYKLPLVSPSCCYDKLLALRKFYDFLTHKYPGLNPENINRQIILDYLSYLATLNIGRGHHHRLIANLREFLEISFREEWIPVTGNQLVYDDDLPKYKRNYKPNYIPEEVIQQIYQHLDELKNPVYRRFFIILINCGMRITELCHISYNCIQEEGNNGLFLRYYQFKLKKEVTIPISTDVVNAIKEQQYFVKQLNYKEFPYLFPSSVSKKEIKAMGSQGFSNAIKKLIHDNDIRDANGSLWHFHSHQCRHTVGTSMINNGVPQHIVQRYLGHESPTMTQVYAHLHDQTLRKEIEKYHESRVVNFQGETAELDETSLSSSDDLAWFKKNVQGRALEHGYCARPKVQGNCDIPGFDGCYNCAYWRTNKNFLPVLKDTLERTNNVLQKAQNCGWELQVYKNTPIKDNLEKVIKSLEEDND